MWQTKYASAVPINLGLGLDFQPCSEGDFLTGRPQSVIVNMYQAQRWEAAVAAMVARGVTVANSSMAARPTEATVRRRKESGGTRLKIYIL